MNKDYINYSDSELKEVVHKSFIETFPQYEEMTPNYEDIRFEEEEIENWLEDWKDEIYYIDNYSSIDDRILALMLHLELTVEEADSDIVEAKYGNNYYEYGKEEYQVLTDYEADREEEEYVENTIEECYLSELTRDNKNHPALNYIDMDRWVEDWCGNRGENLSGYDGQEYEEKVNGETYYIYRKN